MNRGNQNYIYYPVSLNLNNRKCVVIGGGSVALRKVNALLECGASVEVISHKFCSELLQLEDSGMIRLVHRDYIEGDLKDTFLAVAATDDSSINEMVTIEARKMRVLINVVDDPHNSDFIVPSYLRRGTVTISVSTGGSSPAMARNIREKLERNFGPEYASLATLISEVRSELRQKGVKVDSDEWQKVLELNLLATMVQEGKSDEVKTMLFNKLERAGTSKT